MRSDTEENVMTQPRKPGLWHWVEDGACYGAPADLFITDDSDGEEDAPYPSPEAEEFCNRCRVRPECLQYALDRPDMTGVWGGTTDYQRRQLRRATERAKCPGCESTDLVIESKVELCLSCGVSWWTA